MVAADNMLVSVQSQSHEDMQMLTEAVDADLQLAHSSMRTTLGAIEATMSRVVDVDSPYFVAPVLSVPTWSMLHDVVFNATDEIWTFTYRTMRADPGTLNQFKRVLYMTNADKKTFVPGDVDNKCLQDGVSLTGGADDSCLGHLSHYYTVPAPLTDETADYLVFDPADGGIESTVVGDPTSLEQIITITMPHTRVRNNPNPLARLDEFVHPTLGVQREWTFGIGVLFHGVGNNVLIFDTFNLIENSFEQMAISRSNSYSLARHVSFWTQQVQNDTSIRVATVDFVIQKEYEMTNVNSSLNGSPVTELECQNMQSKMDQMVDKTCIYARTLCQPHELFESGDIKMIQFAIPLPARAADDFRVNMLLTMTDVLTSTQILSSLDFKTQSQPQDVCSYAQSETFDPIKHIDVNLYKGHALVVQPLDGSFIVSNDTAVALPETLLTLTFSPKDEIADKFFQDFSDEVINLDDLYISHALENTDAFPDDINNTVVGSATGQPGRSRLVLDSTLLANCMLETDANFDFESAQCVTTHDWSLSGGLERPKSSVGSYFVYRVSGGACDDPICLEKIQQDLNWLKSNVFAENSDVAAEFLSRTEALISTSRRPKSQIYYIFPVYHWDNQSPIGLRDKSIVSFAWSVSKTPSTNRRLLAVSEQPHTQIRRRRKIAKLPEPKHKVSSKRPDVTKSSSETFALLKKVRALF